MQQRAKTFTIVGAGPVGVLMGLLLAQRGHRARLFERRPDPRAATDASGRSINLALSARGLLALGKAGVLQRLRSSMIAMPGRMLHGERQQLDFLPYGSNEREVNYAVSRAQLNRILIEAASENPNLELHFNQRCLDLDPLSGILRLRDERSEAIREQATDIVIAADGAGSAIRRALRDRQLCHVQDVPLPHDYKEFAIPPVATGEHEGYAFEPHALHIWPRGGFMLIALPNTDRSFTATLFLPRQGENSFEQLRDTTAVSEFFRREFPDAAALIPELAMQFAQHPQSQLGTVYCEGWQVAGRALLIGDAAHAIVPFHGQGLNCGFEDCVVLDDLLGPSGDTVRAFSEFERIRYPDTRAIATMALENYDEMRDTVRSPDFVRRKALAAQLEHLFPQRFIPRYSMVSFHPEISYSEALRRGVQQQRVLDALGQRFATFHPSEAAMAAARQILEEAGL